MPPPKAGDRVKVETKDEVIEGILIPRPDILPQDVVVVKLDSGYNIGVEKKRIKKISLVEVYTAKRKERPMLRKNPKLPNVVILSTGGTISSKVDYTTGGVSADYTAEDFVAMYPELQQIANVSGRKIMELMSEDALPEDWQKMAFEIAKELKQCDGVVLTMGTDTMHYAAAALSFMLRNIGKPVVVTGAQRSIDRGSSDAFMNIVCAIAAAAKWDGAEVVTCMHGTINDDYCLLIRGTKVRKMHTSRRDAFRPVNDDPLAKVYADGRIEKIGEYRKRQPSILSVDLKLNDKVAMVFVHPAMDPGIIDYHVKKGVKGIVLAATALGHVPTASKKNIIGELEKAIKKGVVVVVASQTVYGRVHPYVYTNLRKLSMQLGCIFVEDMLPEVAYIKLMYALAKARKTDDVDRIMLENLAGEITMREAEHGFLQ